MVKKLNTFQLILALLSGVVLLFIIAPLAGLFFSTSTSDLLQAANDDVVSSSIWLTLWASMLGTLMFSIFALPLAYLLARKEFYFKKLILGIIDLPIVIPHTAAGIALLGFISRNTIVGKAASFIGIDFIGKPLGIALAMAFVSIPFLITAAYNGFKSVPVKLEKAALLLGASPLRVFFTISIPLAWRYIVSGLILMFARGMSEFGAVVIIAYHPMIAPVLIYDRFSAFGLNYARPVAILFISISLIFFVVLRLLSREKQNDRT